LGLYIHKELFDALAAYVENTRPRTSKTSVAEVALERFLTEVGYWPPAREGGDK
jgi:hypothetical protein